MPESAADKLTRYENYAIQVIGRAVEAWHTERGISVQVSVVRDSDITGWFRIHLCYERPEEELRHAEDFKRDWLSRSTTKTGEDWAVCALARLITSNARPQ